MRLHEIGPLLRAARRQAKLSQAELAQALGMSRATISALETGRCEELGYAKLEALLELVGLELKAVPRSARPTLDELRAERRSS